MQQAAANVSAGIAQPAAPGSTPAPAAAAPTGVDVGEGYAYVRSDLRRIAILAIGLVAVLVALSFVIP